MAFALGPAGLTDAELLHRIGRGDPESAAVLWVRSWPAALAAARTLVPAAEVPGLAAEALVGTIASIAVGSGPAYDVEAFVTAAVHELCEGEDPAPDAAASGHPDVFVSRTLGEAFAALPIDDRRLLWAARVDHQDDDQLAAALSITPVQAAAWTEDALSRVQDAYLRRHAAMAETPDCVDTHTHLGAATDPGAAPAFGTRTWVHLSECPVCTEAFHELAHSTTALGALLGPANDPGPLPALSTPLPDTLEPEAELPPPPEPLLAASILPDPADPAAAPKRRADRIGSTRWRVPVVAVLIALVLAGGTAVALGLGHDDGPGTPGADAAVRTPAGTPSSQTGSASGTPDAAAAHTSAAPASSAPTRTALVAPPVATTPASTPTSRPRPKPSRAPTPTRTPTSASPTPTPTPSPTATPTKKCSPLQHLLGFC